MKPIPRLFGQYEVSLLCDGSFEAPADVITHAGGPSIRDQALAGWNQPAVRMDINCFALKGPDGVTLVDAGAGSAWGPAFGQARNILKEAGIEPSDVKRVLLTHIHDDHMLGLIEDDEPFFPNAEVFLPETDLAFFTNADTWHATPEARRGAFEMAALLQRIFGAKLRTISRGPVLPGIDAYPLPGHSPGHTGYLLHGGDDELLLWGDTLHLADLQPGDPDIGMVYDLAPETAAATRRETLAAAAAKRWTIAGGHVTGFARVERAQHNFRIVPA